MPQGFKGTCWERVRDRERREKEGQEGKERRRDRERTRWSYNPSPELASESKSLRLRPALPLFSGEELRLYLLMWVSSHFQTCFKTSCISSSKDVGQLQFFNISYHIQIPISSVEFMPLIYMMVDITWTWDVWLFGWPLFLGVSMGVSLGERSISWSKEDTLPSVGIILSIDSLKRTKKRHSEGEFAFPNFGLELIPSAVMVLRPSGSD